MTLETVLVAVDVRLVRGDLKSARRFARALGRLARISESGNISDTRPLEFSGGYSIEPDWKAGSSLWY
jgi:hypothetical protein